MAPEMIWPAIAIAAAALATFPCAVAQAEGSTDGAARRQSMQTRHAKVTVEGGEMVSGSLADVEAARDLLKRLPLCLTLKEYAGTEKVSDLSRLLPKAGAPPGHDPSPGEIAYYVPRGNLAVSCRDLAIRTVWCLGKLDHVPTSFSEPGPFG